MPIAETYNAEYIDGQYRKWRENPASVDRNWRMFFEGFAIGSSRSVDAEGGACTEDQALLQARVEALKYRYRDLGHLLACLDPLAACPSDHPMLNLAAFGLRNEDLDRSFYTRRFGKDNKATLREILQILRQTYCRSVGVEYMHIQEPDERRWLQERMEAVRNQPEFDRETRLRILRQLQFAFTFETMLNKKYPGQTRFSLEGAESLIPLLDDMLFHVADQGVRDIVLGMAHRGRLNVLANILQKPYLEIFRDFANSYDPDSVTGAGDVKYHSGYLGDVNLGANRIMRIFMVNNPSHLESVDPVVEGVARGLQNFLPDGTHTVMPVLIHGDAAFAGQGVVAETLNLSQLDGYAAGGTIHIVINNQIGYTTLPENARSTRYSTDIAKMLMIPIFHVHGENPEALIHVVRLACDYRKEFKRDVVIDLVCYRRYGHNEGDEPYFTQPEMYARIKERPPVHRLYADRLTDEGIVGTDEINAIEAATIRCLEDQFHAEQQSARVFKAPHFYDHCRGYDANYSHESIPTGVNRNLLMDLAGKLNRVPDGFHPHPKVEKFLKARLEAVENGERIDWANAEALAFASILMEKRPVRLSGQDCQRGTFSQRHTVLHDVQTDRKHTPLNALGNDQAAFTVLNSLLSETGVLGFEYGYSMVRPEGLTIWEAQFGDFANNAQSVIDLYITSGESKWQRLSGLVMLLPHGLEGLGPEHSSARLERFLQLCADENILVCNPTTPAQYFHLLRRQVQVNWRKPLIVMGPKSLLRNPLAVSRLDDLADGHFETVLEDKVRPAKSNRVILCSGKFYYELAQRREENHADQIVIIRLEQLYPFPEQRLREVIEANSKAEEFCWVQEEPENMGAWSFVRPRLEQIIGKPLRYIGRRASASPATGFHNIYKKEQTGIVDEAVGDKKRL